MGGDSAEYGKRVAAHVVSTDDEMT